jgi:hypothetical protein
MAAICAYLMVAITKKRLTSEKSLNEILQIISVSIFEQIPLEQLLATNAASADPETNKNEIYNPLLFPDL